MAILRALACLVERIRASLNKATLQARSPHCGKVVEREIVFRWIFRLLCDILI